MNLGARLASCAWSRLSYTCRLGVFGKSSLGRNPSPLVTRGSLLARNYVTPEPGKVSLALRVACYGVAKRLLARGAIFEFGGQPPAGNGITLINARDIFHKQKQAIGSVNHTNGYQ